MPRRIACHEIKILFFLKALVIRAEESSAVKFFFFFWCDDLIYLSGRPHSAVFHDKDINWRIKQNWYEFIKLILEKLQSPIGPKICRKEIKDQNERSDRSRTGWRLSLPLCINNMRLDRCINFRWIHRLSRLSFPRLFLLKGGQF